MDDGSQIRVWASRAVAKAAEAGVGDLKPTELRVWALLEAHRMNDSGF
jgi:hypothetical protein